MQTWERLYGDRERKDRIMRTLNALKVKHEQWEAEARGRKTQELVQSARAPDIHVLNQGKARREQRMAQRMCTLDSYPIHS